MTKVLPTEDIRPLSEFRANAAAFVQQVQGTKRPVILTQLWTERCRVKVP